MTELKTYTERDMIDAIPKVSDVVLSLVREGFKVNRIVISNSGRPTIFIFKTEACDKLIESGQACYQYLGNHSSPLRFGAFMRDGCRVQWSEI